MRTPSSIHSWGVEYVKLDAYPFTSCEALKVVTSPTLFATFAFPLFALTIRDHIGASLRSIFLNKLTKNVVYGYCNIETKIEYGLPIKKNKFFFQN